MPVFALRQERENAVEILCEEYPRTFFSDPRRRVPLKHGIEEDIEADLAENKNSKLLGYDIDDTVEWYRSHVGYKKACSVAGNGRVDLRGAVVAKVTEAEARIASRKAKRHLPRSKPANKNKHCRSLLLSRRSPFAKQEHYPLLTEIEKQSSTVRSILGDSPDTMRKELVRPALQLMIDELQTIVARLDQKAT